MGGAAVLAYRLHSHRSRSLHTGAEGQTRVVMLGLGYCGSAIARHLVCAEGCEVVGTARSKADPANSRAGVRTILLGSNEAVDELAKLIRQANVIVATAPPGDNGDPFLAEARLRDAVAAAGESGTLVIYLSSVGVYGDQGGGKVTEETPPAPRTARAKRRLAAEETWVSLPLKQLAIVRLPGIYGPFRGPLAKAREGNPRIKKDGHVFSRIHVDDVVHLCVAVMQRSKRGSDSAAALWGSNGSTCHKCIVNCCDSDPAPQHEVAGLAYELLGRPIPPVVDFDSADLSAMQRSFYDESRYMVNEKLVGIVGSLRYPSYVQGLRACLEQELQEVPCSSGVLSRLVGPVKDGLACWRSAMAKVRSRPLRVALVDNGSLKPEATLSLRRLAAALEKEAHDQGVSLCVEAVPARFADRIPATELEGRAAETLPGWLKRIAAEEPGRKVVCLPLLIGPSHTVTKTMPAAGRAATELEVEVAPPLVCLCPAMMPRSEFGAAEVAGMLVDRLASLGEGTRQQHAAGANGRPRCVLLCDHGSPTAIVASAREAVRAELQRRLGCEVSGCCMERREGPDYDFNGPLLEDALMALPEGTQADVALLFLQEGRHAGPGGDIAGILADVMEKRPDLTIQSTQVLAGHPALVQLLLRRLEKAVPLRLFPSH